MKARLAPVPFLLGLGLLPEAPSGQRRAIAVGALFLLLGLNLTLVRAEFAVADRDLQEFTAAISFVKPGETLFALKPRPEGQILVDVRAAEHYCLAARAVCLGNYEAATRHFPVRLRPGSRSASRRIGPGPTGPTCSWPGTRPRTSSHSRGSHTTRSTGKAPCGSIDGTSTDYS